MLIRNDQERKQAGMPHLIQLCAACDEELATHYPVIFVGDTTTQRTGYHLACAAALVAEIADILSDYLSELSLTPMAQAFRHARNEAEQTREKG